MGSMMGRILVVVAEVWSRTLCYVVLVRKVFPMVGIGVEVAADMFGPSYLEVGIV